MDEQCTSSKHQAASCSPARRPSGAKRTLIFHYHLFKNGGTSIDGMLHRNFRDRWTTQEFHVPQRDNAGAVAEFLQNHPDLDAVSSHSALLPVSDIEGVEIFPIIFIRHSIDRLRSAYEFELSQDAHTLGARLAKSYDFSGYQSWLGESEQGDKWIFCLTAARIAAQQERS